MTARAAANEKIRIIDEVALKRARAIDDGIEILKRRAAQGTPFSANDVRDQLNDIGVPRTARGALFGKACADGILRKLPDQVPSSDLGTHSKPVSLYVAATARPVVRDDVVTVPVRRDPAGRFSTSAGRADDDETSPLFEMPGGGQ